MIARTANYLKAVSHNIRVIEFEDGTSPRHTSEYKGVIIVRGGSQETDYYAAEEEALCRGVGGYRLLRLSSATEPVIGTLEWAERVLNSATRRQ